MTYTSAEDVIGNLIGLVMSAVHIILCRLGLLLDRPGLYQDVRKVKDAY